MICKNCGYDNEQEARFCKNCGQVIIVKDFAWENETRLLNEDVPFETENQKQEYNYNFQTAETDPAAGGAAFSGEPFGYNQGPSQEGLFDQNARPAQAAPAFAVNMIRKSVSSVLFLAGCCAFTLSIVLSIIESFAGSPAVDYFLELYESSASQTAYSPASGILLLVLCIPSAVMAAGLWLSWAMAGRRSAAGMKTAGFTIIKVMQIINMVIDCIAAAAAAAVGILYFAAVKMLQGTDSYGTVSSDVKSTKIFVIVYIAAAVIVLALMFIFWLMSLKAVNSVKETVNSAQPSVKISLFIPVFAFVIALADLFMAVIFLLLSTGILSVLEELLLAAAYAIFGIAAIIFRQKVKTLKYTSVLQEG